MNSSWLSAVYKHYCRQSILQAIHHAAARLSRLDLFNPTIVFALVPLSTDILSSFLWFPFFSFPASIHLFPSNRVNSVFLCMRYPGFCEFHHHWDSFCFDFAFCHFPCCWLFCCSFHVMTKCSFQYRKSNLFSLSSLKMIKYQISLWQSFTGTILCWHQGIPLGFLCRIWPQT